jgi:DNA-binding transcriptional regulator/RsmH inhibitor MraZ
MRSTHTMSDDTGATHTTTLDFYGNHRMSVDKSQRVAIPSKLSEELTKFFGDRVSTLRVLVTNDSDKFKDFPDRKPIPYLKIMPIPVFQHFMKRLRSHGYDLEEMSPILDELELDGNHRFRLNRDLLDHLGVDPNSKDEGANAVYFVGNIDSILLFSLEGYQRRKAAPSDTIGKMKAAMPAGDFAYNQ